jgi:hypothetical protein
MLNNYLGSYSAHTSWLAPLGPNWRYSSIVDQCFDPIIYSFVDCLVLFFFSSFLLFLFFIYRFIFNCYSISASLQKCHHFQTIPNFQPTSYPMDPNFTFPVHVTITRRTEHVSPDPLVVGVDAGSPIENTCELTRIITHHPRLSAVGGPSFQSISDDASVTSTQISASPTPTMVTLSRPPSPILFQLSDLELTNFVDIPLSPRASESGTLRPDSPAMPTDIIHSEYPPPPPIITRPWQHSPPMRHETPIILEYIPGNQPLPFRIVKGVRVRVFDGRVVRLRLVMTLPGRWHFFAGEVNGGTAFGSECVSGTGAPQWVASSYIWGQKRWPGGKFFWTVWTV